MPAKAFFLIHLNNHIQYLKNLEKALKGESSFQGSGHQECALGRWLHSEAGQREIAALKNTKARQLFESLLEPHERFHEVSRRALEKRQSGELEEVHTAVTEMHVLSHLITQKLLELDALS